MVGQGIMPAGYNPIADGPSDAELREFLSLVRETVTKTVAGMPDHQAFLERHSWAADAA